MAELKIRNMDDWVVEAYRARARQAGRSLEEELRLFLTEAALERRRALAEELGAIHEEFRRAHGELPDSTPLIRADRDERG